MSVLQIDRLRREDNWNVDDLADELYVILGAFDTGVNGPVAVNAPANGPAMTFNMPANASSAPVAVNVGGTQYTIPAFDTGYNPLAVTPSQPFNPNPGSVYPPPTFGAGQAPPTPNFQPGQIQPPPGFGFGTTTVNTGGGTSPPPTPGGGSSAASIPDAAASGNTQAVVGVVPSSLPFTTVGQVVSGSGASYQVSVFLGAVSAGSSSPLPATALGISADDQVPAGTYVYVTCQYTASRTVTCYFIPFAFAAGTP